ncbi:MAG: hypothetical protein C4324_11750 [Blastocatellia bacterium]
MKVTENKDKSRLWIITELYYPELTSTGYYMTEIAEGLAGERPINVICGQPNYSARGITAPRYEERNGVRIFRLPFARLNKNVFVFRLLNVATLALAVLIAALWLLRRGDRVLVVTTPPLLPFVAAFAALVRGCAYTLLIHDVYPDLAAAVGKTRRGSLIFRITDRANRWLYKHCAKIIVVGRDMVEKIRKKAVGLDPVIEYIPNWAELETVFPRPRQGNELLGSLGVSADLVLLYAGNFGYPNDIESILEAANILGKRRIPVHFLFVGDGVKRKLVERAASSSEAGNITYVGPRPRSEQSVFLNACDIGLVSLVRGMLGVSMPSRTYNLFAAGRPILAITESGSELEQTIREASAGWCVEPGDGARLAEKILEILENRESLSEMGERARDAAVEQFNLPAAIARYRSAID